MQHAKMKVATKTELVAVWSLCDVCKSVMIDVAMYWIRLVLYWIRYSLTLIAFCYNIISVIARSRKVSVSSCSWFIHISKVMLNQ